MAEPRVTVFSIDLPLWAHGLEEPQSWLLAPRAAEPPRVLFASAGGTLGLAAVDVRNAMFPLFDAVWLRTANAARVNIIVQDKRLRVVVLERMTLAPVTEQTIVTCYAPANLDGGVELGVRGPRDEQDLRIDGTLAQAQRGLVDALVGRGAPRVSEPVAPVAVCRRPREIPAIQLSAYCNVCERLVHMIAAHPKNAFMEPLKPAIERETVAIAREVATAAPESDVAQLMWLVSAIYAHRTDSLKRGDKKLALAAVRERTEIEDPVYRLAPAILALLGEEADAKAEARAALASIGTGPSHVDPYRGGADPTAAYRAWLQRILERP